MLVFLNNNPALTAIIVLFISVILAYIGWNVVYSNSKKIASRNETYGLITHMFKLMDDLLIEATDYWLTPMPQTYHALHAKNFELKISSLKKKLNLIKSRELDIEFDFDLRKIRRSITLDAERVTQISESIRLLKIEDMNHHVSELKINIFRAFECKYPQK